MKIVKNWDKTVIFESKWGQIMPYLGQIRPYLGQIGQYWAILSQIGPYWASLSHIEPHWAVLRPLGAVLRPLPCILRPLPRILRPLPVYPYPCTHTGTTTRTPIPPYPIPPHRVPPPHGTHHPPLSWQWSSGSCGQYLFTRLLSDWRQWGMQTFYWPYSDWGSKVTFSDWIATGFWQNGQFWQVFSQISQIWPNLAKYGQTSGKWVYRLGVWVYGDVRNGPFYWLFYETETKSDRICHCAALFISKTWKTVKSDSFAPTQW